MTRISKSSNARPDDIELPLLNQQRNSESQRPTRIKFKSHFLEYLTEFSSPLKYITDYTAWAYITFADLWPQISAINASKKPYKLEDLPLPFDYFNVESKIVRIDQCWMEEKNRTDGKPPSYAKALLKSFQSELLKCGVIMFAIFLGRLFTTIILGRLIYVISKGALGEKMDQTEMVMQAIYFSLVYLATNIVNTHYWNYCFLFGSRVRLATVGFVYKKLQSIAVSSLQQINIGKVINLLASDLNDLDYGICFVWPFLLFPITISLATYTMWDYFGGYTLVSIAWLFASFIISGKISERSKNPRIEKNAISDERVKLSNELIECIRLIKMYAWGKAFRTAIDALRLKEYRAYLVLFSYQALSRGVVELSSYLAAYFMFVAYVLGGGILAPEKIYSTLMILTFVKMWCIMFPANGVSFSVNGRVMQKRIEDILNIPDVLSLEEAASNPARRSVFANDSPAITGKEAPRRVIPPIEFKSFTGYWNTSSPNACLKNLNITIKQGQVTALIGKVGAGKSTLLLSVLKELPKYDGTLNVQGSVAYVEQEPIIFSGTARENILFGRPFNDVLYQKIVRAASLRADFAQFSDGDQTMIGEKGTTLSGGQKARISLARALYSRSDIYLLDDPLSAVDSKVARHIFDYAIRGSLLRDRIVILVTHHISFAKEADNIVIMDEGKAIAQGSYEELSKQKLDLLDIFTKENKVYEKDEKDQKDTTDHPPTPEMRKSISIRKSTLREDGTVIEEVEEVPLTPAETAVETKKPPAEAVTAVTFNTYKNYVKAAKSWVTFILMVSTFFIYQLSLIYYSKYMGSWALEHQAYYIKTGDINGFNHTSYIVFGFFLTCTFFITNYLKVYMCGKFFLEADNALHAIVLRKITRAFTSFFDTTPIGSILNRFSNDLGMLDKTNWETFHNVGWGFCMLLFTIATVCFINPLVMFPAIVIVFGLVKIRDFFAKASIETKRLDLISRSPLYSEISATMNGLLIIRVFQQGGRFVKNFMDVLYNNSRALIFMQRTQAVFGLIIDFWIYWLTVSGIFIYLYIAATSTLDPSLFGLAMVLLLDLCNGSAWIVKQSLQLDVNMQSAERLLQYTELPEEAAEHREKDNDLEAKGKWPTQGQIVFRSVSMKYSQDSLVYALKDLDFTIEAGQKIGVVGRTGAGKSSIIQALFRMVEIDYQPNSAIVIDGVNIRHLGLEFLRKNLSIIPQTAVIFTGTIRRNLDPFDEFSDYHLWNVLGEVRLETYVRKLEKQLDTDMTLATSVFSAGQKQLMCLARAILRSSKIIVLDEATANVDIETDNFIQEKINEKFKDCTVITVAHRLTTIAHYDKILVLEQGGVVEYDKPYNLLAEKEGDKKITRGEGWFAKMVANTGENTARRIFEITYNKHYNLTS